MAEPKTISYAEVYAQTEIVLEDLGKELPDSVSREVYLEIIAQSAFARLKRKGLPASQISEQIKFLVRHLVDEAPASPLEAKQVLLIVTLDDAIEQQFTRAFDDQLSDRQHEFSLNFGSRAMANRARIIESRARTSARIRDERQSSRDISLAEALEAGRRRIERYETEKAEVEKAKRRAHLATPPPEGGRSATKEVSR